MQKFVHASREGYLVSKYTAGKEDQQKKESLKKLQMKDQQIKYREPWKDLGIRQNLVIWLNAATFIRNHGLEEFTRVPKQKSE